MRSNWLRFVTFGFLAAALACAGCGSGSDGRDGVDGADGQDGAQGQPGGSVVNASQVSDDFLAGLDVVSEITNVQIASPPVITFTLFTASGVPITGIVPFWEEDDGFVRMAVCKLVAGTNGDPDRWVSYTRDSGGEPTTDRGASLVDNGDGSYTFTLATDVATVPGVPYEPTLTHRIAGQIGDRDVPMEPQNLVYDYVPSGGPLPLTHNVATMASCNECHDNLVFHGRRFEVEYCVTCHNADLASGEGDFSFMIHRIHSAGAFTVLGTRRDPVPSDFGELTYPQDLRHCLKCHNGADPATADGDNWWEVPNIGSCTGCHDDVWFGDAGATPPGFENHLGGPQPDNSICNLCHGPGASHAVEVVHTTPNATPNNPRLIMASDDAAYVRDQRSITYELISAEVDGPSNDVTIVFKILSDGNPLDMTSLPADMAVGTPTNPGTRWPGFLLAYALPQDGIDQPMDYNNRGREGGQPISVSLGDLVDGTYGTMSYDGGSGENTADITVASRQFPLLATLRAVGLQGYFYQDLDDSGFTNVSLHTPSAVVAVDGDDERRTVVDNAKCASCHEWFEGHGGNRTYNIQICTLCHVPNLSSSGRTVTNPLLRDLDDDLAAALLAETLDPSVIPLNPLTYPEESHSIRDLVHGIHSSGFRTRPFQFVRGPGRQGYYDMSHVTFPRGASTSNCELCHEHGTYELPLPAGLLPATVRTTSVPDGMDALVADVQTASENVPNDTDWINTPTAGSCFMCHTTIDAMWHMMQNGALLSWPAVPIGTDYSNRDLFGTTYESCMVCHGPGKVADIEVVHGDH